MEINYSKNHSMLDIDVCRRVLNRCHRTLVNGMNEQDIVDILREIERTGLLDYEQIRDIGGLTTTSMQARILLSKISQKSAIGYKKFVRILFVTGKVDLLQALISAEDELLHERKRVRELQQARVDLENLTRSNLATNVNAKLSNNVDQTRDSECNVCMDARLSVVMIPCGHALCSNCGERMLRENSCCFCKQAISRLQSLFF